LYWPYGNWNCSLTTGDKTAAIHSRCSSNGGPPVPILVLTALIAPKMASLITRHKIWITPAFTSNGRFYVL